MGNFFKAFSVFVIIVFFNRNEVFGKQPAPVRRHKTIASTDTSVKEFGLGSIWGYVTGAIPRVSGVTVTLMQNEKIMDRTTTDDDGNFHFPCVAPGAYDIRYDRQGYRSCITLSVPVHNSQITENDIYLPVFNNDHMSKYPIVESYERNLVW